jgi:NRPS condensation-like uncharacterized protein
MMNLINQRDQISPKWYRLDTAANLYPAIRGRKRPGVFRISATLTQAVQPDLLQLALNTTLKRIPNFSVKLRSGLFWHYFVHSNDLLLIREDVSNPCMDISSKKNNGFLIRVRYHGCRIAVEVFHSVSDGSGAMTFLKTLIAQYLNLLGYSIPPTEGILDCKETPDPSESKDCFQVFAGNSTTRGHPKPRAYHIKGSLLPPYSLNTITGTIPTKAVRSETKKHGVSITEYMVAVYLFILNRIQLSEAPRRPLPIKIQVPVNLRHFYETKTLRNFSAFVSPGIDPAKGKYTFEEILDSVHHFLRYEVTKKHLRAQVAANVRSARNPFIRMMPLLIKKRVIHLGFKFIGPISFTSTISNLGIVNIPAEMAAHVKRFDLTLGATQDTNVSCGMLGYAGNVHIFFSRVIEETLVEREFFSFLVSQGLPVAVESNRE